MKTEFEQGVQSDLRHSEQLVDADQLRQLAAFRQQALEAMLANVALPRHRLRPLLWPTAGMALASILLLVLALPFSPFKPTLLNESLSDNRELYDDLEFYYWLAENEEDLRG